MPDSAVRLQRAHAVVRESGRSRAALTAMLSDHADRPSSICSHPDERQPKLDQAATVASVVMDLGERRLWLADGQPCHTPYRELDYGAFLAARPDTASAQDSATPASPEARLPASRRTRLEACRRRGTSRRRHPAGRDERGQAEGAVLVEHPEDAGHLDEAVSHFNEALDLLERDGTRGGRRALPLGRADQDPGRVVAASRPTRSWMRPRPSRPCSHRHLPRRPRPSSSAATTWWICLASSWGHGP